MFSSFREWYKVRQLLRKLDNLFAQFDNLVAFDIQAGDKRYQIINVKIQGVLSFLIDNHGYSLLDLSTMYPKLDLVQSYNEPVEDKLEVYVKQYTPRFVVTGVVIVIVYTVIHALSYDLFHLLTRWVQ
jgi:hypothetical protein